MSDYYDDQIAIDQENIGNTFNEIMGQLDSFGLTLEQTLVIARLIGRYQVECGMLASLQVYKRLVDKILPEDMR